MTLKTRTEEKPAQGSGQTRAVISGENGMVSLITLRAREIVQRIHTEGSTLSQEDRRLIKDEIQALLLNSDAPLLIQVEMDLPPLRCKGDPFERGKISNLYSALSDCKEYLVESR